MTETVDIVDIAALFGTNAGARKACDDALWAGLRRTGAVVISGYPGADEVDARARTGLAVFDLPEEDKRALSVRHAVAENPNWYRGFWPLRDTGLLQNEFHDIGPDAPAPGPDLPGMEIITEATPWPAHEPVPGWSKTVRDHYDHLHGVAQAMIRSIGRSAGFPEDVIGARFDGVHSTLRFLSYPAGAKSPVAETDAAQVSAGRHTDQSGLSLLWQAQPGLQAQGQDGAFRSIPILPNAISVHVGEVMTGLTDGTVPATPHRVLAGDGHARQSVAFFLEPANSAQVTPVTYTGPNRVENTYGYHLLRTLANRPLWDGIIADPALAALD